MRVIRAMTPFLVAAAMLASSAVALAQTVQPIAAPPPNSMPPPAYPSAGYGPPPPPPAYMVAPQYTERRGFTVGLSFGVGGMGTETGAIDCFDCEGDPLAGGVTAHIGYMISPRLSLLLEWSGSFKNLDAVGAEMFIQSQGLIGAQYWLTPKLWLKGGLGASYASVSYDDGWAQQDVGVAEGGALAAAIGYEILSGPRFAIDLQARLGVGLYESFNYRDQIESGHIGVGFSWF